MTSKSRGRLVYIMTQHSTNAHRAFQTAVFATALLLSSPLAGLIDNTLRNMSPAEKSDLEITFTELANNTVIFKS